MKEIKLVVCDIDGTLITDKREFTPKTKEVIERLHAHGVLFGIASGRSVHLMLSKNSKKWGFDWEFDVIIGMNGSELQDNVQKKRFDYYALSESSIKEILEMMSPLNMNPFIYDEIGMLYVKDDETVIPSGIRNNIPARVAENVSELYAAPNAKVMFRMTADRMEGALAHASAHPSDKYQAFKTQATMLEFADPRVNKSVALIEFCKMHDIDMSEVVAFGDMSNDNEMLSAAGLGVCLLNGADDTKACADVITEKTNDEEGFADYVEKYILIPRGW